MKQGTRGNPAAPDVFDETAETYSESIDTVLSSYGAEHAFFTRHKARLIFRLLARAGRAPATMDLLDIGCGVGAIHPHLGSRFRSLTGVDTSRASIARARRDNPGHRYAAYGERERLPFEDASYDMTLAICVLHHVPPEAWPAFVCEMMRVLRPGGLALVIEHNPLNPVTQRIVSNCPIDADAVMLSRQTCSALFDAAGAVGVRTRSILSVPPVGELLMSVDGLFGRLPFGAQYYTLAGKAGGAGA